MKLGAIAVAVALVAAALIVRRGPSDETTVAMRPSIEETSPSIEVDSDEGRAPRARISASQASAQEIALQGRLQSSSLRGALPDGAIPLDPHGRVDPDPSLLRRFDWYLSLDGEFRTDEIRTVLLAAVRDEHGADVASEVALWFDRYLGLRETLKGMALASDIPRRIEQLRSVQRQWFGEHADELFGAEIAELRYTASRRSLLDDASLSPDQRDAALARLDADRPASARSAEREASSAVLLEEQTEQFEQLGLDAAQRREERAALWGEAAADRLAQLDEAQAAWDARIADYLRERDLLMRRSDLSRDGRERLLQTMRERLFDPGERSRIEALEGIGQLQPRG